MSRPVRILSLCREGGEGAARSVRDNLKLYAKRVAAHLSFKPDFVVFPETASMLGVKGEWPQLAEPEDGRSMEFFRDIARRYGTYVVGGCHLKPCDNAAPLIDRDGGIVGIYRKTWPTGYEYTWGSIPGPKGQSALNTEFGPVGLAICYDAQFPELWAEYGEQGARIAFWISMYPGGALLNAYAVQHGYYVVTATAPPRMRAIDPLGRTVAACRSGDRALEAVIDLDEEYVHMDYANLKRAGIEAKYGKAIAFEEDGDLGWYRVRRTGDGPPIREILAEFGLMPLKDFLAAQRRDIDRQRATRDAPPYPPAW